MKGNNIAIKSDRETFARLLVIQGSRGINIRDVLCYELSSVPLSLANPDKTLRKTVKSKLFQSLIPSIPTMLTYPSNTPPIFDGMVLLQKLPPTLKTFGEVSDYLLKQIVNNSSRISFFVTDHYLPNSIKSMEREHRSGIGLLRIRALRRDQAKPKQFDKYLRDSENKIDLIKFLLHDWSTNTLHCPTLDNKELYITIEENTYCITSNRGVLRISEVSDLQSHQEEADTKMFLCASYASILGFERVKIITVDTDVAILALYFQSKLDISIYMEIGTGSKVHYLIFRQIQSMMKLKMCCLLFMPFRVAIQQAPLVALGK